MALGFWPDAAEAQQDRLVDVLTPRINKACSWPPGALPLAFSDAAGHGLTIAPQDGRGAGGRRATARATSVMWSVPSPAVPSQPLTFLFRLPMSVLPCRTPGVQSPKTHGQQPHQAVEATPQHESQDAIRVIQEASRSTVGPAIDQREFDDGDSSVTTTNRPAQPRAAAPSRPASRRPATAGHDRYCLSGRCRAARHGEGNDQTSQRRHTNCDNQTQPAMLPP